ncbi:hypothetical protein TrLO_g7542 [Triparma laevis f. longispina]|uniref:MULE transposase domain-containing protein n=1 Tax=Triparma laevis f. longispina TaxID=1714387 RepID=A0A9W7CCM3_9STRA|nr:hypothetical protein TrLO_g7542 [Triparma laevis f. longispina]
MAHSLNPQWGTMHVGLCTLDGDGRTTMLAWGVCAAEDTKCYIRFLRDLKDYELPSLSGNDEPVKVFEKIMNKPEHIVISDRDKGIVPAIQEVFPRAGKKHCMWHVKENIKKKIGGANNWDETLNDLVSEAWKAPTEQEFNAAMKDIMNWDRKGKRGKRGTGHKVWEYLCKIPVEEWALWPIADSIKLYGQVVSTQIEGLNNTYKDARKNNPTEVFEWINDWCFKELSARQEKAAERKYKGELLTESAAKMLEHEKEESACYRVAGGIINPGYVVHRNGQQDRIDRRRVDWEAGTCTCYRPQQYAGGRKGERVGAEEE